MIRGIVSDDFGFVATVVDLPRLRAMQIIRFIVDTGSQSSFLSPGAADLLGLDYGNFRDPRTATSIGLGGPAEEYVEPAILTFAHLDGTAETIALGRLGIVVPTASNRDFPSILGLDVLRHFRMTFEPRVRLLQLDGTL